jgi:hypothetical protein
MEVRTQMRLENEQFKTAARGVSRPALPPREFAALRILRFFVRFPTVDAKGLGAAAPPPAPGVPAVGVQACRTKPNLKAIIFPSVTPFSKILDGSVSENAHAYFGLNFANGRTDSHGKKPSRSQLAERLSPVNFGRPMTETKD